MTKDAYYEMCEQLGTDPEDGDIPIDFADLLYQSQMAVQLFEYCTDKWDGMGGYLGKDLSNIEFLLKTLGVDKSSWLVVLDFLNIIIPMRVSSVNKKMKTKAKVAGVK